jgi:hypothetical protein
VYYKIDLSNYEPKEVPEYNTYNDFVFSADVIDNLVLIDLKYVPRTKTFDLEVKSLIQYE